MVRFGRRRRSLQGWFDESGVSAIGGFCRLRRTAVGWLRIPIDHLSSPKQRNYPRAGCCAHSRAQHTPDNRGADDHLAAVALAEKPSPDFSGTCRAGNARTLTFTPSVFCQQILVAWLGGLMSTS